MSTAMSPVSARSDGDAYYQAILAHDARFDGVFFVGVSSTGIYCRCVCPAKTPRRENCTFHPSAAAAERAGFRPCLRCRPELAPGGAGAAGGAAAATVAPVDAAGRLAALAASRIEDGALSEKGVSGLAEELGVSDRHLRRVVEQELGVTPVELGQTQRLLLAKRLLTDTDLSVTEVALASGFGSLRRFNALFRERYRLNPTGLRRARSAASLPDSLVCEAAYRPPLDWDALIDFLSGRTVAGVEAVTEDGRYVRSVRWGERKGWIAVSPAPDGRPALRVEISASLAAVLPAVLARVKRQFDLTADPERIAAHLGALVKNLGLRVTGSFDPFETAVRAILGQQISVRSATTLACRFASAFGEPFVTLFAGVDRLSPTPERVAALEPEELIRLGIITARAKSILALAQAVSERRLTLDPGGDIPEMLQRLKELPGIGEWTAQIIALRALGWPDAFPHSDLGVMRAMGETDPKRVLERAEAWRPWRAYATMHLWRTPTEEGATP